MIAALPSILPAVLASYAFLLSVLPTPNAEDAMVQAAHVGAAATRRRHRDRAVAADIARAVETGQSWQRRSTRRGAQS